jgi:hypothetical protein
MGFIWQTKAKMNDFILTDPEDVPDSRKMVPVFSDLVILTFCCQKWGEMTSEINVFVRIWMKKREISPYTGRERAVGEVSGSGFPTFLRRRKSRHE